MTSLREIIQEYNLAPKKSLGQNFILDLNLLRRIVKTAKLSKDDIVVEVGPGPGGLTRAILENDIAELIAIEKDSRCIQALKNTISDPRLRLLEADALEFDYTTLPHINLKIIANLPYNISTILLIDWLKMIDRFESLTLMFQKEVAQRIVAKPGSKDYGRLSVIAQWVSSAKVLFDLSPEAFTPPPKVFSSIVQLTPLRTPLSVPFETMELITRCAFGTRRKMLRSSLKTLTPQTDLLLEMCHIDPTLRAERLEVKDFVSLAQNYLKMENEGL
jgi:16S rRNA (adenine1518-N6/adenine1519-N6)-dimethyltransferase